MNSNFALELYIEMQDSSKIVCNIKVSGNTEVPS